MATSLYQAHDGSGTLTSGSMTAFAEEELKQRIVELSRYIEPTMIVLMGGIIGAITQALMLPIVTISKVIVK